jgi:enoyl-CoA hydratase / 3-hydroxyacyl-CoA dehydrogenase
MFVFKTGVVGAGGLGAELARLIAAGGIPVTLCDRDRASVEAGVERVRERAAAALAALVSRGRIGREQADAELERTLALITPATSFDALGDVDFAIEAAGAPLEPTLDLFAALDAATPGRAILASAGCLLPLDELAAATTRPHRLLGFHLNLAPHALLEIVETDDTSPQSMAAAASLAAAIRTSAIRCLEAPGYVLGRVLISAASELWRIQQERGLDAGAVDRAIVAAGVAPLGPFALADRIGPTETRALAELLREAYGERFHGAPNPTDGAEPFDPAELAERFTLKALVESCLALEEGVVGARELELALRAGAGLDPPPLAGADARGLDVVAERLERAASEWGERFAPPALLRRLVAQGRRGAAAGQGFFPAPRPDAGQAGPVALESRGEVVIAWLDNPPANAITFEVLDALRLAWRTVEADEAVRVLVLASANPGVFCAGADIRAFQAMDAAAERELTGRMHALLLELGRSPIVTIAAVGGVAYGGGCELAMAADIRVAARSASFGQPEIKLGIVPGFGGTQRLARLVGAGKALERNLTGEPLDALEAWELGLVSAVVEDLELLDEALAWARRLAAAPPLAVAEIKRLHNGPELEAGLTAELEAFARVFATADAREGIAAFLEKRTPRFDGI